MKSINVASLLCFIFLTFSCSDQESKKTIDKELLPVQDWINAWEFVNSKHLKLKSENLPELVFFDSLNVYSTSKTSIPYGFEIDGPNLFGKPKQWYKTTHEGLITLPTNEKVPVGLMSFAAPSDSIGNNYFFVMAMPSFWKMIGVSDHLLGTDNLYKYVFLHEFSHIMQGQNFGLKLTEYDKVLATDVFDDMIQKEFENDISFTQALDKEMETFLAAYNSGNREESINLIREGIRLYYERQNRFFIGEKEYLKELDDFFLTMEGSGQYLPILWFADSANTNIPEAEFLNMKAGSSSWSQKYGMILFLVYSKIAQPELGTEIYGDEVNTIIHLLEREVL